MEELKGKLPRLESFDIDHHALYGTGLHEDDHCFEKYDIQRIHGWKMGGAVGRLREGTWPHRLEKHVDRQQKLRDSIDNQIHENSDGHEDERDRLSELATSR